MSTRCNVIVKDKFDKFFLYHHCDGYPEGVGNDLVNRFKSLFEKDEKVWWMDLVNPLVKDPNHNYELTDCVHLDVEYLYTIDCDEKTIYYQTVTTNWNKDDFHQTFGKKQYLLESKT